MSIETGSLRLRRANWSRTWPACLTPRDNFKVFGDVGLYATLALISIAAGAGASESAATKQIGRTEEESSSRVDHIERTRQKDEPKRPSSKNRRHDALRSELASWPIFYLAPLLSFLPNTQRHAARRSVGC